MLLNIRYLSTIVIVSPKITQKYLPHNTCTKDNYYYLCLMKTYHRQAIMDDLSKYCHLSGEDDFIEITLWHNGEGFDVTIGGTENIISQFTFGQFEAMKEMVRRINKQL